MPLLPQGRLCENMLSFSEILENMNSLCVNVKEKRKSPGLFTLPSHSIRATATAGEAL